MQHGGDLSRAMELYGGEREDWLDLSTGINQNPWPIDAKIPDDQNLLKSLHHLPAQLNLSHLLNAARGFFQAPQDAAIVAASGVQTLIQWLAYLAPHGTTAILGPTYCEYNKCWSVAARDLELLHDPETLGDNHRHIICVNPNNPDGRLLSFDQLKTLAEKIKARDGWLIIDESFIDPMPDKSAIPLCVEFPVLILRSFGKFFGLPGLRLGFLIAQDEITTHFRQRLGPWPVSSEALVIGAAAYADAPWAADTRKTLAIMADKLATVLTRANLKISGGTSLFQLVSTPTAKDLHHHLATRHIWSRSFDHDATLLRFGVPASENDLMRLEDALRHESFHS